MAKVIKLTPRLKTVAEFAEGAASVADIGTDHGLLAAYLAQQGAKRVIAADKNEGPLAAAAATAREYNLRDEIILRRGDGLQVLSEGEAEVIVIAGMGGELIAQILSAAPAVWQKCRRLILQPMNDACVLRRFLEGSGWHILCEKLAAEGKRLYTIIVAEEGGGVPYDEFELAAGRFDGESDKTLLRRHFSALTEKARRKEEGLAKSRCADDAEELLRTRKFMKLLTKKTNGLT